MPRERNFVLENKNALLSYFIDLSDTWDPHDVHGLFKHVERTFKHARGTTWAGKSFWQKLEHEEALWERECDDGHRRRGHEEGSEYDQLMAKWTKIWSKMTAAEWQWKFDHNECDWEEIPEEFRKAGGVDGFRVYAYAEKKLERVVDAACQRAMAVGKTELAMSVRQIYRDSMNNPELRELLEKVLTQEANEQENARFQEFVKIVKKKIKDRAARANGIKGGKGKAAVQGATTSKRQDPPRTSTQREPASPEEIRYDPPGCTCSNCKGGKEWQDTKDAQDHTRPKKPVVESSREEDPQAKAGASPQRQSAVDQEDDATLVGESTELNAEAEASNAAVDSVSTATTSTQPATDRTSLADSSASSPLTELSNDFENSNPAKPDDTSDWSSRPVPPPPANMVRERAQAMTTADGASNNTAQPENQARQPHADPLVTKILGDLQYEPAVQQLLQHDKPLPSEANVRQLNARESALDVMRTILEHTPAARTDLEVFVNKLQAIENLGRREDAAASRESSARKKQQKKSKAPARRKRAATEDEEVEDENEQDYEDDSEPEPVKKRLRARSSTDQTEVAYDRLHNRWPCPVAKETGCTTLFSKPGHAVRHARTVHDGNKDIKCPDCGKAFARHDNMNQHRRNVHRSGKRSRESRSTSEEAEDADLEEARRAHKRRKSTRRGSNASWNSEDNAEREHAERNDASSSRESSPLTEFTSEDEEQAKEAYLEEQLRTTSNQAAKEAVEAVYGPMSPTEAGGDDDAVILDAEMEDIPPPPPPPPPEADVPADPLRIISDATAAAVAKDPGIARLEAKIDSLLNQRANGAPMIKETPSTCDSPAPGKAVPAKSPTEALASIAEVLQSNALDGQSPEVTQLLMRMARDAADATIYAGEAMRRAGELTKNVTMMLEKICEGGKTSPQAVSVTATATATDDDGNTATAIAQARVE
ncbi:Nutrient and stress factor 1 [Pseudocercospora fuligena]|uniref:Nutrient and stress factor 1 n=1 Tax=Pseudocercospora fuligena TaxID=685502 RepID=A0A8H6RTT8_9PEZI|nr:Nutrient and stress factor 1 [Pseudocercospora fuligena]